jgi:GYF domain 2
VSDVATLKSATTNKWWVQIRGRAFGPYSIEQMATFLTEGRVRPTTLVSANGKSDWIEARRVMALRGLRKPANGNDTEEAANVFVHAEIFSGSWMGFMAALESMGFVCDLGPGLWLVRTRFTSGVIRNTLSQTLERGDRFVVIDATRDRLAWFNLGPEVDVRISKVWNGPLRADNDAR